MTLNEIIQDIHGLSPDRVLSTSEKCTKNAEVKVYHFMLLAMHFLVLAR